MKLPLLPYLKVAVGRLWPSVQALEVEDELVRPHPGEVELLGVEGLVGALDVLRLAALLGSQQVELIESRQTHHKH